jgi:ORF6N domain
MDRISPVLVEKMIHQIRGLKVMIDSDLAELYEIDTRQLNRQVRRNPNRFPPDFMFQLSNEEYQSLMCQNGTSNKGRGGRQKAALVFTEPGIAMLSSVLTSERAVLVNISIMRTFIKLRSFLAMESSLESKVSKLQEGTNKLFKVVFERLDSIEAATPELSRDRKKIGLNLKD